MLSFGNNAAPQSFCHWCPVDDDRLFKVGLVCQVAAVVMETTQLVLSQFKNFLS